MRVKLGDRRAEVLADVIDGIGGRGTLNRASAIFGVYIPIAEEELARLNVQHPAAFSILFPTELLRGKVPDLYRAHVRELLERLVSRATSKRISREVIEAATDAEILSGLYEASARAPLRSEGAAMYDRLFAKLFPEQWKTLEMEETRESWSGQVEEDIRAARGAMRNTDRGSAWASACERSAGSATDGAVSSSRPPSKRRRAL